MPISKGEPEGISQPRNHEVSIILEKSERDSGGRDGTATSYRLIRARQEK
jgi:hypothetical protein